MADNRQMSHKTWERIDAILWKIMHRAEAARDHETVRDADAAIALLRNLCMERHMEDEKFLEVAERFRAASDPEQVKQLGNELGRFVFGE
jgi:hypothetical protein